MVTESSTNKALGALFLFLFFAVVVVVAFGSESISADSSLFQR